jgi:hypothetical protein
MPHRFMTDGPLQPRSPGEEHALTAKYEALLQEDRVQAALVREEMVTAVLRDRQR